VSPIEEKDELHRVLGRLRRSRPAGRRPDDRVRLEYSDDDHDLCQPAGDPESPVFHSDSDQFEAGTGIPIATFTKALKEFLVTARRPTCVEWREVL
jgi:hypothetical protein